jgi:hypothetical protein
MKEKATPKIDGQPVKPTPLPESHFFSHTDEPIAPDTMHQDVDSPDQPRTVDEHYDDAAHVTADSPPVPPAVQHTADTIEAYLREGASVPRAIELAKIQLAREIRDELKRIPRVLAQIVDVLGEIVDK